MTKRNLLIIHQEQFGYHSDTYYYCKYLSNIRVTYICWDYGRKRIQLPKVKVIYISRKGNLVLRNARFIFKTLTEIKQDYDYHFIKYFRGCSLVKLLSGKHNFILDIRSGAVFKRRISRITYNTLMKSEIKAFTHISIISENLARKLGLPPNKHILPLGADQLSSGDKSFSTLYLLYVGTLYNRNIHETIMGFSAFHRSYRGTIQMHYTIVGSGFGNEEKELENLVKTENLERVVSIKGYVPHDELKPYFDRHNIGIAYVPMTPYFHVQPPTKTFEYLLSGMPVIATNTLENRAVINNKNGVLISDTQESFYKGLVHIYKNRDSYDSADIRSRSMQYTWKIYCGSFGSAFD